MRYLSCEAAGHTGWAIFAHALLRIASSAQGVLVGLYLAVLSRQHSVIQAGLVGSLGAASYGAELLASVPLGVAADALSVRALMVAGALASAIGVQLFALTLNRPVLFLSQLLQGVGVAGVTPPLLKFLAQSAAGKPIQRARVMSFFELSMLTGLALGGLVGTQAWVHLNVRAFSALASIGAGSAALLYFAAGSVPRQGATRAWEGLREALRNRCVRGLAPTWICVNAIVGLWLGPTLTFLLTERPRGAQYLDGIFATSPADIGWLMLAYTVVFAAGVSIWAVALPRMRLLLALRLSLSTMFGVCIALFAINHSACWPSEGRWVALSITALLIMIESGFTPAALSVLARSLEPMSGKGAAMGIYSLLLGLGAVTGSLMAGALGTALQLDGLLLGTVALAALALLMLRCLPGRTDSMEEGNAARAI